MIATVLLGVLTVGLLTHASDAVNARVFGRTQRDDYSAVEYLILWLSLGGYLGLLTGYILNLSLDGQNKEASSIACLFGISMIAVGIGGVFMYFIYPAMRLYYPSYHEMVGRNPYSAASLLPCCLLAMYGTFFLDWAKKLKNDDNHQPEQ